ncbi:unnamed protein product, partial [Heterotrigona itama]
RKEFNNFDKWTFIRCCGKTDGLLQTKFLPVEAKKKQKRGEIMADKRTVS